MKKCMKNLNIALYCIKSTTKLITLKFKSEKKIRTKNRVFILMLLHDHNLENLLPMWKHIVHTFYCQEMFEMSKKALGKGNEVSENSNVILVYDLFIKS